MTKTVVKIDPVKHFSGIIQNVSFVSLVVFKGEETVEIRMKNGNIFMYKYTGADVKKALPMWCYCTLMVHHFNKETEKFFIDTPPVNSMTVNKFKEIINEVVCIERLPYINFIDNTYDLILYKTDRREIHARYSHKDIQDKRMTELSQLLKTNLETQK